MQRERSSARSITVIGELVWSFVLQSKPSPFRDFAFLVGDFQCQANVDATSTLFAKDKEPRTNVGRTSNVAIAAPFVGLRPMAANTHFVVPVPLRAGREQSLQVTPLMIIIAGRTLPVWKRGGYGPTRAANMRVPDGLDTCASVSSVTRRPSKLARACGMVM